MIFLEPPIPLLVIFSVYTNSRGLFAVRKSSNPLECLNGIRVLSMLWIMLLHTFTVYGYGPLYNATDLIKVKIVKEPIYMRPYKVPFD